MERQELRVTLLTGRTIEQGVAKEHGKSSAEYMEAVAVCFMSIEDMKALEMKSGQHVLVSTGFGSVVVKALKSQRASHERVVLIPYGPWANAVVDPSTNGIGMPSLKGIQAKIKPSSRRPLSLEELLETQFGKEKHANR